MNYHQFSATEMIRYVFLLNIMLLHGSLKAEDRGPGLKCEYRWENGYAYTYKVSQQPFGACWETQIANLEAEPGTDTNCVLLYVSRRVIDFGKLPKEQSTTIKQAFSVPVFVRMGTKGQIESVRVPRQAANPSIPVTAAQMFVSECVDIFFLPHLPDGLVDVGEVWKDGPKSLRVVNTVIGDGEKRLCRIEQRKRDVVDTFEFDLISGKVLKMHSKRGEMVLDVELVKEKRIGLNDRDVMLQQHQDTGTLDDFIRAIALPRWRKELSPEERRDVYRLLQFLDDDLTRSEVEEDALSKNMGCVTSMAWANVMLSQRKGMENRSLALAVAATGSGNTDVQSQAASLLHEVAGVQFSKKQEWSEWLNRIRGALPDMLNSTSPRLAEATSHKDPWVRLFALKQLSGRSDIDIEPILEKAISDPDEKVKAFVTATLKKLKKESEEKDK